MENEHSCAALVGLKSTRNACKRNGKQTFPDFRWIRGNACKTNGNQAFGDPPACGTQNAWKVCKPNGKQAFLGRPGPIQGQQEMLVKPIGNKHFKHLDARFGAHWEYACKSNGELKDSVFSSAESEMLEIRVKQIEIKHF